MNVHVEMVYSAQGGCVSPGKSCRLGRWHVGEQGQQPTHAAVADADSRWEDFRCMQKALVVQSCLDYKCNLILILSCRYK